MLGLVRWAFPPLPIWVNPGSLVWAKGMVNVAHRGPAGVMQLLAGARACSDSVVSPFIVPGRQMPICGAWQLQ